jgi:hypothetical protein
MLSKKIDYQVKNLKFDRWVFSLAPNHLLAFYQNWTYQFNMITSEFKSYMTLIWSMDSFTSELVKIQVISNMKCAKLIVS